jgi:uncharacterized DUF497 family protein
VKDEHFERDDEKAARNWRDHAVTFEMARLAFDGIFAVEWEDDGQDDNEQRVVIIGMAKSTLLFVTYTMRGHGSRIISARKAEPYE